MKNLTEGNIYKTFILFAIPVVLAGLLSQAYDIIDTIIAGKFLGTDGLAATGATSSFLQLLSSMFWGYITGFSIYTAVLFGGGEYERLKSSLYSNFILLTAVNILISLLCIIFKDRIFDFLKVDSAIRSDASTYFTIMIAGRFLITLNTFGAFTLNAMGISGYPFKMSIVSTVLNISGNILSVTVLNARIAGIAVSSLIAALAVDILYIIRLSKCFKQLGCGGLRSKIDFSTVKHSISYGIPVTIQQIIMYFASFIISPVINSIGSSATAAYSVITKIYNINAGVYQNSAKTVSNFTAQAVGGKKFNLIKKGVYVGLLQGIVLLLPFLLVSIFFANGICSLFFPAGYSGESLEFSVVFIRFYLPFILFNLINNLLHSLLRGVKCMNLLVVSTAIGSVTRIISSLALAKYFGLYGVYSGWVISWIAEAIFSIILYFSGVWKKKIKQ